MFPQILARIFFALLLLKSSSVFANEIDQLKTNTDVNKFLVRRVDAAWKKILPLEENRADSGTCGIARNRFFKTDLDNNRLTDLIVYGRSAFFVVMDSGKGGYFVHNLNAGVFELRKPALTGIDSVSFPHKLYICFCEEPHHQNDTLIYTAGGITEYNVNPDPGFSFEELSIKTTMCFGTCPVFEMKIRKDQTATYHAIQFNDETGTYHAVIPVEKFNELMELVRYLPWDRLKTDYAVGWTDDQSITTEIHYNGKVKIINDYGKIGTYGLSRMYKMLFNWRKSIEWVEY